MLNLHEFPQRETASIAAATCLAARLRSRLQTDASANLVISGGSTPVACFRALAEITLDWERVGIFLSDERWVDPEAADSVTDALARGFAERFGRMPPVVRVETADGARVIPL